MKKSLIALAALSAIAGVAQAQSSVTVYGNLDAGWSSSKTDTGTASTYAKSQGVAYSSDVSSRFGLKGTEDIGGGLKASFQYETGIGTATNGAHNSNIDGSGALASPASNLGSRAIWAALTLNGTEAKLGYQDTATRQTTIGFAADSATNVVGNILTGNAALVGRTSAISLSQEIGGFKLGAGLSGKTTTAGSVETDAGQGYSIAATYAGGPLSAGIAYQNTKTQISAVSASGYYLSNTPTVSSTSLGVAAVAASDANLKVTSAGASYDLGVAKLFAQYGRVETKDNLAPTATTALFHGENVGVQVPLGKTALFATYGVGKTRAAAATTDYDVKGYVAGARYSFSKRTTAYAVFGEKTTDTSATAQTKVTQYAVGVNHSF